MVVNIQLKAEGVCCTNRTKFDWSDDIYYHKIILNYWFIRRKAITKRQNVKQVTQKIYDTLPLEYQQYIDIASPKPYLNWIKTKEKLKCLMAQHKKTLQQRLQVSLENRATYTGSTAEKVKLKKEQVKSDKKLYNTLRQNFHPCQRSGISHLLLPDNQFGRRSMDLAMDLQS